MAAKVTDLRSALKMLEDMPGQLIETDVEPLCVRPKKDRQ